MFKRLRGIALLSIALLTGLLAACCSDSSSAPPAGVVRTYYVAAEDVPWNYAPTGVNQITGIPFANLSTPTALRPNEEFIQTRRIAFDNASTAAGSVNFSTDSAALQIGTTYKKSLYFQYTSASFTVKKPVDDKWKHTGFLGPVIRAEVGDTIRVVFKNKTQTGRNFSMHPHGVFYTKPNEGAPYVGNDPSSFTDGNSVPPGSTYTYEWQVPDRAGPGPSDGPSVQWMYHSPLRRHQIKSSPRLHFYWLTIIAFQVDNTVSPVLMNSWRINHESCHSGHRRQGHRRRGHNRQRSAGAYFRRRFGSLFPVR